MRSGKKKGRQKTSKSNEVARSSIPVVIQATHQSLTFEGKSTVAIKGEMMVLGYLIDRLHAFWDGKVIVATSTNPDDDAICREAVSHGASCVRGPRRDLLSRLWLAVEKEPEDHFVRAFGNYPLLDLGSMASLVQSHIETGADYSYNDHREGVPWGMGCEVVSKRTLETLRNLDLNLEQQEAGTLYIRQNPSLFRINRWSSPNGDPTIKLALETRRDLMLLRDIVEHVKNPDVVSVLAYLAEHPALAFSNRESPPQEVGLEKILLHAHKIGALRAVGPEVVDSHYPISVELSLTNRCNLNCVYCSDKGLRKRQGLKGVLKTETVLRLCADLKQGGAQGIVLEGGGEPTLHPDFETIVDYLAEIKLPPGLITNGTRALPPRLLKCLEWVRVSVDASMPEEWRCLKGRNMFNDVLLNLRQYTEHCPTVGVGYVVTNNNMSEIESFVFRMRQLGISYIQFRPVIDSPDLDPSDTDLGYLSRYETKQFSIIHDGMRENLPTGNLGLPCRAHSLTSVISADGGVFLCGRLNIHSWVAPIGNVNDSTFKEIWEGEERAKQARQVLDPEFCKAFCPRCRLTKFNSLLDRLKRLKTPHFI